MNKDIAYTIFMCVYYPTLIYCCFASTGKTLGMMLMIIFLFLVSLPIRGLFNLLEK